MTNSFSPERLNGIHPQASASTHTPRPTSPPPASSSAGSGSRPVDIIFHKQALASTTGNTPYFMLSESLIDTMDRLGHSRLRVLKIDIEGSEWEVFDSLISSGVDLPFDQLLIELHFQDNLAQVFRFFEVTLQPINPIDYT